MSSATQDRMVVGKIVGLYGVHGWVKVFSHTDPKENVFAYAPWLVQMGGEWRPTKVLLGRTQGKGLVAQLEGCADREQARLFIGAEVAVLKSQLPKPAAGEYYWADLIGLEVTTLGGQVLGKVDYLLDTGANDVLVVQGERERLIPFVRDQYVHEIDLAAGTMKVDWDPEF